MQYSSEIFRLPQLLVIVVVFIALIIFIAGKKGIGSIIGLAISLGVIFFFIIPQVLSGANPLLITMIGSIIILFSTTYIAHGFSIQTSVALVSTFISLILTVAISALAINFTKLSGFGSEEAYELHMGVKSVVDFQGLMLSGIIIATLGALNDVTTTQSATIFEIFKGNKKLNFDELLKKGLSVGREHVISLVNTLVLAFVGSSFVLFLVYFVNPMHTPLLTILNTETISEEIIRTISGTAGLLLSMPIVTILASFICVDILGERVK